MSDDTLVRHGSELEPVGDPVPDPGLAEHRPRPTDVDERAARRAERQVATLYGLSALATIAFCVAYFVFDVGENPDTFGGLGASNVALGVTFGLALLFLGFGTIQWARKLMSDHEVIEARHPVRSSDTDRDFALAEFDQGVEESGIKRRPLIRNSLLGAAGLLGVPAIILLRDLGPLPGDALYHTVWRKGVRIVRDVSGDPISAADLQVGDLVNAQPDLFFHPDAYGEEPIEGADLQEAKAKAAVIVLRLPPGEITPSKGRENWGHEGILCFSKICTHVGCPISLLEQQTHHLLCPCHQSTFDLTDNGKVIFGPANRSLPQLPLAVDTQGFLVAQSDFTEPVGPSFWERG